MGKEDLSMKQIVAGLVMLVLMMPKFALASGSSALFLSSDSTTQQVGSRFDVQVKGVSNETPIDTLRAVLTFDPLSVRAQAVSLSSSFDRSAPGNFLDNKQGLISWGAFTLDRPVQGAFDVLTVTFLVIKEGDMQINLRSDSKMISDGTEMIDPTTLQPLSLRLQSQESSLENGPKLNVSSRSHKELLRWYQQKEVIMDWTLLPDEEASVSKFLTAFDQSSQTDPTNLVSGSERSVKFVAEGDGTYYFHIKAELEDGQTTPTVHTPVNIDTSKPNDFVITTSDTRLIEGETLELILATTDEPSGVAQYQLAINEGAFKATNLPIQMQDLKAGTYFFRVAAIDRAGNTKYASASVRVYPQGTDLHRPIGYNDSKEIPASPSEKKGGPAFFLWIVSVVVLLGGFFLWKRRTLS
jgi:hypothetical protein